MKGRRSDNGGQAGLSAGGRGEAIARYSPEEERGEGGARNELHPDFPGPSTAGSIIQASGAVKDVETLKDRTDR